MGGKISDIISEYQSRYPMYTLNAIADMMVKDGVITQDIARLLKAGTSLFILDKMLNEASKKELVLNPTEIWGGNFSSDKQVKSTPDSESHPQKHKLTSLVDVDKNGEIYSHQFTSWGIRQKYDAKKYKISEEKLEYGTSVITVMDRKTNKKVISYEISPERSILGGEVFIKAYDKKEFLKEYVIIHSSKNDFSIGRVDKFNEKDGVSTFYDYNSDEVRKTYKWETVKKDVWDITEITLYANNKPYKVIRGEKTIVNYQVNEIVNCIQSDSSNALYKFNNLLNLIKCITKNNVYEVLTDYKNTTGSDLINDINDLADKNKKVFYIQTYCQSMLKHIRESMSYQGGVLSNDSWFNHNAENYIVERLIDDLSKGRIDDFKKDLKLAGLNLDETEKDSVMQLFGNSMVQNVLVFFQKKSDALYKNDKSDKGITKGILYTIAKSKQITPEERANILIDIISQIGFIVDPEIRQEMKDFISSNEFMNLILEYSSKGKYCDDIKADIALNRKNPDKILVDLKRLKNRNKTKKENSVVTKPNGKIDVHFKQGNTGDCWLIAGVISLCKKAKGKVNLESLLKVDEATGNVTVFLKGVNKKYLITYDEIKNANHLASGDGDLRAIELAFDKYIRELAYNKELMANSVDIEGNTSYYLYNVLFGNGKDLGKYKAGMEKEFNNPNKSFCLGANNFETSYADTIDVMINSKGEKVNFITGHAYAVVKADEKYVYLINPWDSKETLRITHENLEKINASLGECSFKS